MQYLRKTNNSAARTHCCSLPQSPFFVLFLRQPNRRSVFLFWLPEKYKRVLDRDTAFAERIRREKEETKVVFALMVLDRIHFCVCVIYSWDLFHYFFACVRCMRDVSKRRAVRLNNLFHLRAAWFMDYLGGCIGSKRYFAPSVYREGG